ncbi:MAG: DUF2235 domain-containing protein [Hyphomonadaceae bacterium]|nr:DUF2235 domain-containing protein [Hyphomonadaceae bacterium]
MKKLVICCDGTWQRVYRGELTNVALTARSIATRDANNIAQIVYYSAGVGADLGSSNLWNGMTGADLDQHLLDAYLFLNLNYEPGDQIFLFGFSRGAYTVRTLAGLLRKCGVLRRDSVDKADDALELYRDRKLAKDSAIVERFRAAHAIAWPRLSAPLIKPPHDLRIAYLGVWDTVGSLGIPSVLPIPINLNRRYQFHDTELSRSVEAARHAVAIDERRGAFKPALWSNVDKFNWPGRPARVLQAWFPGDHGGVGGGPARGLSNCSLMWVIEGAEQAGLAFSREPGSVLSACLAEIDPIGAPVKSGKGFSILDLTGARWRKGLATFADVHETARLRWIANKRYRPALLKPFADEIAASVTNGRQLLAA